MGPGAGLVTGVTPGDRATADMEGNPSLAGTIEYSKGSAKDGSQILGILGGEETWSESREGSQEAVCVWGISGQAVGSRGQTGVQGDLSLWQRHCEISQGSLS